MCQAVCTTLALLTVMKALVQIVLILISVSSQADAENYYVEPTESSTVGSSCVGTSEPCHTLSYYTQFNNFTSGATFLFLPGNHILLRGTLNLTNISNVTLKGRPSANINSRSNNIILCKNTSGLRIDGLNFYIFTVTRSQKQSVSALKIIKGTSVFLNNNIFQGTGNLAVLTRSQAYINNCTFQKSKGSALHLWRCTAKIFSCTFTENEGTGNGGAIFAKYTKVSLEWNDFSYNSDPHRGGAIHCSQYSTLKMSQSNWFYNNRVVNTEGYAHEVTFQGGGAVNANQRVNIIVAGNVHFKNNTATAGGAIYLRSSKMKVEGTERVIFQENKALSRGGGGIYGISATISILNQNVLFTCNYALGNQRGGAVFINNVMPGLADTISTYISGIFTQNKAAEGGAIFATSAKVTLGKVLFSSNTYTAVIIEGNRLFFNGTTQFIHNYGGAIEADSLNIYFNGKTLFLNNTRTNGGALHLQLGKVKFMNYTTFEGNKADSNGGAIHALGTSISVSYLLSFTHNNAGRYGGAVYLGTGATITLSYHVYPKSSPLLRTTRNYAGQSGGALYCVDTPTLKQCSKLGNYKKLPKCPIQLDLLNNINALPAQTVISSSNDTARTGKGHFVFGGFFNKCRMETINKFSVYGTEFFKLVMIALLNSTCRKSITSKPYELCICEEKYPLAETLENCKKTETIQVHRGQMFNVSLLAAAR